MRVPMDYTTMHNMYCHCSKTTTRTNNVVVIMMTMEITIAGDDNGDSDVMMMVMMTIGIQVATLFLESLPLSSNKHLVF